jgi:hypothetical protein
MIMLAAAALAMLQPQITVEPGTPPEVARAFGQWASCMSGTIQRGTSLMAEVRASNVTRARCESQLAEVHAAQDRWLATAPLDEAGKRDARRRLERSIRRLRGEVAGTDREPPRAISAMGNAQRGEQ